MLIKYTCELGVTQQQDYLEIEISTLYTDYLQAIMHIPKINSKK